MKKLLATTSGVLTSMIITQAAFAEDALSSGNTAWILTSTALVLFMTIPGLSLFYGGLVREDQWDGYVGIAGVCKNQLA